MHQASRDASARYQRASTNDTARNEFWVTALQHQRGCRTIQPQKTTSDFRVILQVEIVAARPHTLGRSNTNPVYKGETGPARC